jgi:hypothetical protein
MSSATMTTIVGTVPAPNPVRRVSAGPTAAATAAAPVLINSSRRVIPMSPFPPPGVPGATSSLGALSRIWEWSLRPVGQGLS